MIRRNHLPRLTKQKQSPDEGSINPFLKADGKEFAVAASKADNVPYVIARRKGHSFDEIVKKLLDGKFSGISCNCMDYFVSI